MSGALPHYKFGPASYTAAGLILGGQLVTPATSGSLSGVGVIVQPTASAGTALTVLGVAGADANTGQYPEGVASFPTGWPGDGGSGTDNQPGVEYPDALLDVSILGYTIPVYNNVDIVVNYDSAGTVNFGQLLMASTSVAGAVTAFTGAVYSAIVGRCSQPGGVTAGSTGRAFIRV